VATPFCQEKIQFNLFSDTVRSRPDILNQLIQAKRGSIYVLHFNSTPCPENPTKETAIASSTLAPLGEECKFPYPDQFRKPLIDALAHEIERVKTFRTFRLIDSSTSAYLILLFLYEVHEKEGISFVNTIQITPALVCFRNHSADSFELIPMWNL
jgi:hypothetical protein